MGDTQRQHSPKTLRIAHRIQPRIIGCDNCQPTDDGGNFWMVGVCYSMDELLEEHNVPIGARPEVAKALQCPCGTDLAMDHDVGVLTSDELRERKFESRRWRRWESKHSAEVDAFYEHLKRYPYLGAAHPVGRRIAKAIEAMPRLTVPRSRWWRARRPDGARRITGRDMGAPPVGKAAAEGRFNHYGQSVLYLASGRTEAALEVLRPGEALVWVRQYAVATDSLEVLNLVLEEEDTVAPAREDAMAVLAMGLVSEVLPKLQPDETSHWKPEYFIPRYIADCARHAGVLGIQFPSKKHFGKNLVLFDWNRRRVRPIGPPEILLLPATAWEPCGGFEVGCVEE